MRPVVESTLIRTVRSAVTFSQLINIFRIMVYMKNKLEILILDSFIIIIVSFSFSFPDF